MSGADYFSIDDILAECEGVHCEFCLEAFNLVNLEQNMIALSKHSLKEINEICLFKVQDLQKRLEEGEEMENDKIHPRNNSSVSFSQVNSQISKENSAAGLGPSRTQKGSESRVGFHWVSKQPPKSIESHCADLAGWELSKAQIHKTSQKEHD